MQSLVDQIGFDTISKFEAAADRRLLEARALRQQGLMLGSVYLCGYVVEARLKAAYFRLDGFGPDRPIERGHREGVERMARELGLMSREQHDVLGWARMLVVARKRKVGGFAAMFEHMLLGRAQALYGSWRPAIRYRAIVPRPLEATECWQSALWFHQNYRRMWR